MAEEKTTAAESDGAPPSGQTRGESRAAAGRPRFLLLTGTAVIYVVMVLASSLFTQYVVVPRASAWLIEKEVEKLTVDQVEQGESFGTVYMIEDLVVNPAGSDGTRYVCVSLGLESRNPEVIRELEIRDAQVKDCLITTFGSKSVSELVDVDSRERIRREIKERVEEVLPPQGLDGVYFVNFVLQ